MGRWAWRTWSLTARRRPGKWFWLSIGDGQGAVFLAILGLVISSMHGVVSPFVALALDPSPTQATPPMSATDAIPLPPPLRSIASPSAAYLLTLTAHPETQHQQVTATLFESGTDRCQPLWTHPLPQAYGPRLALVSDRGRVLLLDEWINVASPYAMVVLDRSGEVMAQHSFDDIVTVSGSSRAEIVEQAKQGFWIAGDPTLHHNRAVVPAAGGALTINLETGQLNFR